MAETDILEGQGCSNGALMFSIALTQTQKRVAPFKPQECAAEIASYDCFHFQDT